MDALPDLVGEALKLDRREVRRHSEERFGYKAMVTEYENLYRSIAHAPGRV